MFKPIIRSSKNVAGLAVLSILAIAVVAGQAKANLPAEATAANISMTESSHLILELSQLRQPLAASKLMEALLTSPTRVEKNLDRLADGLHK